MDKYIASKVTFPSFVSKIVIGGYGLGRSRDPLNLKSRSFNILAAILLIISSIKYCYFGAFGVFLTPRCFNIGLKKKATIQIC